MNSLIARDKALQNFMFTQQDDEMFEQRKSKRNNGSASDNRAPEMDEAVYILEEMFPGYAASYFEKSKGKQ